MMLNPDSGPPAHDHAYTRALVALLREPTPPRPPDWRLERLLQAWVR